MSAFELFALGYLAALTGELAEANGSKFYPACLALSASLWMIAGLLELLS